MKSGPRFLILILGSACVEYKEFTEVPHPCSDGVGDWTEDPNNEDYYFIDVALTNAGAVNDNGTYRCIFTSDQNEDSGQSYTGVEDEAQFTVPPDCYFVQAEAFAEGDAPLSAMQIATRYDDATGARFKTSDYIGATAISDTGSSYTWTALWQRDDYAGELLECDNGDYATSVTDNRKMLVPRVDMDDDNDEIDDSTYDCEQHGPIDLTLVYADVVESNASERTEPAEADCVGGSGTFKLLPWHIQNEDADSYDSKVMKAVQESGTGQLTGSAWITKISVTEDRGQTLLIAKTDTQYQLDSDDLFASNSYHTLSSSSDNNFSSGVLTGTAPFLVEEDTSTGTTPLEVDIEWSCGSATGAEELHLPRGYRFDSAVCSSTNVQDLTVRPVPPANPNRLHVSLYGHSFGTVSVPLIGPDKDFDFDDGTIKIVGELVSNSANQAKIKITSAKYNTTTICPAGTYTLALE